MLMNVHVQGSLMLAVDDMTGARLQRWSTSLLRTPTTTTPTTTPVYESTMHIDYYNTDYNAGLRVYYAHRLLLHRLQCWSTGAAATTTTTVSTTTAV